MNYAWSLTCLFIDLPGLWTREKERERERERERESMSGLISDYVLFSFSQTLILKNTAVNSTICNLASFSEYKF